MQPDTPTSPLPASLNLAGRIALVTGGSRGIGRAIAQTLGARGATVLVNFARNEAAAQEVCSSITEQGGVAHVLGFDVSNTEAVDAAFAGIKKAHGGLDILVNNAGISIDTLLMRAKLEDFQRLLDVNVKGTFACSKAAARLLLRARDKGRIINLSSIVGEQGNTGQSMYAATKAAILGLTKSLAREFSSRGVTVNAVAPGFIATDMTASAITGDAEDALLAQIPLRRVGQPQDIAETVAFLASPAAAYITGQVIGVNGGMRM
ncbi:MAG: 3-oxoacyl-ACP reductase family protein [Nannocystaceae bacterium]